MSELKDSMLAEARRQIEWLCNYAYANGAHELGYDPVKFVFDRITPPPRGDLRGLCYLYWSAYHAGHHDTVEGQYTDVLPVDRFDYWKDRVDECLQSGDMEVLRPAATNEMGRIPRIISEIDAICHAYETGHRQGLRRETLPNPYSQGSDEFRAYVVGHAEGLERAQPAATQGECSTLCHPDEPCAITEDGECDLGEAATPGEPKVLQMLRELTDECEDFIGYDHGFPFQEVTAKARAFLDSTDKPRAPEVCGCPYGNCTCDDGSGSVPTKADAL